MLHKLFLSFLLFVYIDSYAQVVNNFDSIEKVINAMPDDSSKTIALRDFAQKLERIDSAKSKLYYFSSIALSKKIKNDLQESLCYLNYAVFKINSNQYDSAEVYGRKALIAATKANSLIDKGKAYNLIGNSFLRRSKYETAINNYREAATIYENIKEDKRLALVYANIAATYIELSDTKNAIRYGELAITFAEKSKDNDAIGRSYFNTGAAYGIAGDKEKYIIMYKKGLPFVQKSGIENFIQQGYYNIANGYHDIALQTGKLDKAAALYADSSLQLARKMENPLNIFHATNIAAQIAIENNKLHEADNLYKEAYTNLIKDSSNFILRIYYGSLALLRYRQGNFKEAYELTITRNRYNDSILANERIDAITESEAKYESEKKEIKLKLQQSIINQKNTLNILLGSIATAILGLSLFGFKNYKHKQNLQQQKISELETQHQLTATEAVLKGEEQERTRLAKDLHDGLGGMLSGIKYSFNTMKGNMIMTPDNAQAFERSMDMLDSSIKEMRRVAHNMMPEALVKFGLNTALKDFCNEIQQSGALHISYQSIGLENEIIDQTVAITVYRIVQELINNTMKHAVAKNAIVQVTKSDGQLSVTVEDDGKGFDTAIINNPIGMGWSNITNRVEFLKGKLDVNSQSGKGTSVHIEINI
jgi:two-component system, NarL family, sensor kinase